MKELRNASCFPQPLLLDAWERLPNGRYAGRVDGRSIWLAVSLEGRLPSDPRVEPGYIEALGGRIYVAATVLKMSTEFDIYKWNGVARTLQTRCWEVDAAVCGRSQGEYGACGGGGRQTLFRGRTHSGHHW